MSVVVNQYASVPSNGLDRGGAYTPTLTALIANTTATGNWHIIGDYLWGDIHIITSGDATVAAPLTATIPTQFTMNPARIPTTTTATAKASVLGWGTWWQVGLGPRDVWAKYDSAGKLQFHYVDQQLTCDQLGASGHSIDIVFRIPIINR